MSENSSRPAAFWIWAPAALSCIDGFLTVAVGFEGNPLLCWLFKISPLLLLGFKIGLIPIFMWLGNRTQRLARDGLVLSTGWYGSIVLTEIAFMYLS